MENNEDNRQMTVLQELLQLAFNRSYYADLGTGDDTEVIDMMALEEIVKSLLPKEKKQRKADWIDGFIKDLSPSIFDDGLRGMMKYAELRYNETFKTT